MSVTCPPETRASANTSGSNFTPANPEGSNLPMKLRTIARTARRKLFLLPDRKSKKENSIQPPDLMSRRHPLSSIGPSAFEVCP